MHFPQYLLNFFALALNLWMLSSLLLQNLFTDYIINIISYYTQALFKATH